MKNKKTDILIHINTVNTQGVKKMRPPRLFRYIYYLIFAALLICTISSTAQETKKEDSELLKWLKTIPGVEIETMRVPRDTTIGYKETYRIYLEQPLDHNKPGGKKFRQQIFLSHADKSSPVILVTRGYTIGRNRPVELSRLLCANQIIVEHRFFGRSAPEQLEWKYLNIKQAAADHHRITELFKKFYKGKWVNTGVSKGGQTALFHRRWYPDDVDVTVAYVAPINAALHDKRVNFFIDKRVGTKEERDILRQFQIRILENRDTVLPIFIADSKKRNITYSIGDETAFEYIVLEYTFSFWQYGDGDVSKVPGKNATPQEMLDHLKKVVGFRAYSSSSMDSPSMYQNHTEIGYYNYIDGHLKHLLRKVKDPTNIIFAPEHDKIKFKPSVIKDITKWLQYKGNNIIYINGGNDPWGAPALEITGNTNAVKIIVEKGNHGVKIRSCTEIQKKKVCDALEKWLDMKIVRN